MFTGVYSAATAMDAAERKHEIASTNLAFSHLPGYRRGMLDQKTFEATLSQAADSQGISQLSGSQVASAERLDLNPGAILRTGNPLDLALQGDGYFVIESESGPLYTRSGAFRLNDAGELVTVDGLRVKSSSGNLIVPAGVPGSDLQVTQEGRLLAGNQEIGQLEIVRIAAQAPVERAGASLIRVPEEYVEQGEAKVIQHSLESSNVRSIEELVTIMIGSRQYEAAQRIIRSLSDIAQSNIQTQKGS